MSDQEDGPVIVEEPTKPDAPSQAEQDQAAETEGKILRQVTFVTYEGGGFKVLGPEGYNPMNDLSGLLGDLEYAKKWILEQWELAFLARRVEVGQRLAAEARSRVIPGSAAPAFLRSRGSH